MKRAIYVFREEVRAHALWLKGGIPDHLYKYLLILSLVMSIAYVSINRQGGTPGISVGYYELSGDVGSPAAAIMAFEQIKN